MSARDAVVICDSPVLSLQLCRQLAGHGWNGIVCLPDPALAIPDGAKVVIIELMLSETNGFSLLRTLGRRLDLPLVLVSGTGRDSDRYWGKSAGATAVIERPLNDKKLAQLLACCKP
jgi:DNA-binding response OmpR family regulator